LEIPNVSMKLQSILKGLLEKNPKDRLGYNSSDEIKNHPWFEKVNWNALLTKSIKAPFVPILTSDADTSNFDEDFTNCSVESYSESSS
jgi:serum/glucocorticoid-regulated kinase 2